jgi:amphi-Trp domain-containing protein
MGKKEVEFKGPMNTGELMRYLEGLLDGLKKGVICVRKGEEYVVLTPSEQMKVEIEAEEKKDKNKFSLEIAWSHKPVEEPEPSGLSISTQIPTPELGGEEGQTGE